MISSVIGLGKLGFPFALFLASKKIKVLCYDNNPKILKNIKKNKSPYIEPYTQKYLKKYRNNISITSDLSKIINKSDISHLVLPTPSLKNNSFSNKYIIDCLNKLALFIKIKKRIHIINITSTVMPGSCRDVFCKILESKGLKNSKDFIITYNPHFIAQGTTINNLENPDFVLIGADDQNGEKLVSYYNKIYKKKIFISLLNTQEAEIVKISVNSYVTSKITFSNFISEICESVKDVDGSKVLNAIGRDHRIGNSYLGVGTKYSGPCFPRDNKALDYFVRKKTKNSLPKFVDKINNSQTGRLIKIIKKVISKNKLNKINLGILGLTYKDKTSILKDSQSYDLIKKINLNKLSKINVYDKNIKPPKVYLKNNKLVYFKNLSKFIKNSKILLLMYPSKNFINELLKSKDKIIIDCWNMVDEKKTVSKIYKLGKYI
tara:strand:+ start:840 stop:2138 length:1299 start_codon:yes stop_codon:yes gene_type:complete